jgi:hypothetical protein
MNAETTHRMLSEHFCTYDLVRDAELGGGISPLLDSDGRAGFKTDLPPENCTVVGGESKRESRN